MFHDKIILWKHGQKVGVQLGLGEQVTNRYIWPYPCYEIVGSCNCKQPPEGWKFKTPYIYICIRKTKHPKNLKLYFSLWANSQNLHCRLYILNPIQWWRFFPLIRGACGSFQKEIVDIIDNPKSLLKVRCVGW